MGLLKALNLVQFQRTLMNIISFYPHSSVVRCFPLLMVKEKLFLRTSDFWFSDLSFISCFIIT